MSPDAGFAALKALAQPDEAARMAAYHKVARPYLGVRVPLIDDLARGWRQNLTVAERVTLARGLWATNVHEGRVAAAKLFEQARIRPDDAVWDAICDFVPDFDAWAIADHVSVAGAKRLLADPARIDRVETWTNSPHLWTRRAALVITLPWTKQNHPSAQDLAIRDRVLGWAAGYVPDRHWFIQKAIAWWLRELSRHDAPRVQAFLAAHGDAMVPFARAEAGRLLNRGAAGKDAEA
jgi:3-methyladenine DNA glycosylase AlkD